MRRTAHYLTRISLLLSMLTACVFCASLPGHAATGAPLSMSDLVKQATQQSAAGHRIETLTDGRVRVPSPVQAIEAMAAPEGITVASTKKDQPGSFTICAETLGRADSNAAPVTPGVVSLDKDLARIDHQGFREELTTNAEGIRQDFLVQVAPQGSGELALELSFSGAALHQSGESIELTLPEGRKFLYRRLHVTDSNGNTLPARFELTGGNRLRIVVADAGAAYPVRIDPTITDANWVSIDGPGTNNIVNAVLYAGGNLYAGGQFTAIGGITASCIAKWNGSSWSALGSGFYGSVCNVYALAWDGTNLYAGGQFSTAGGTGANNIAKWDGNSWSALNGGISGAVYALAWDGVNLYAGGSFSTAGGNSANDIAKWNGSTWSALGSGMNSIVMALAWDGVNLYAGGYFTSAGGGSANYIAKWNGSSWSALGSGMNSKVTSLAWDGANLYAGGGFTAAGGTSANYIAEWDGNSWSALGSGTTSSVYALAWDGANLYAGGNFYTAGGTSVNNIAKWNGSSWSALGSGMNSAVNAMASGGANLYAGGFFTTAGGKTATVAYMTILPPDAPTINTTTAGNAQASVTFTAPALDGGSIITSYTVSSNPGNITATGTASPITVTGLANGTAYTFTVTATNAVGTSAPSGASNSVVPVTVPGAPTIGIVTAGNAQATVSFTAPASNGGSAITGYTVTSNPGNITATGAVSPITVTGLTNGTHYTFTVTAANAVGTSASSGVSNSVTPATVPGAPTIGTATAGNAQATVSFTAPASNGGSSITSYTVTSNPGNITAPGAASPITVTGLTDGLAYTFTVRAANAAGTSASSGVSNSVIPADTVAPTVTAFTLPAMFANLDVPVTTFVATDNVGVTGYLLTETATTPSATANGWSATAPSSYTFSTTGSKTLYAWAKDAAGNVSAAISATVIVDTTGPTLTLSTLADGAITNNSTLNISGAASDPDGIAAVAINGLPVSVAAGGTFSSAITLVAGSNTITTVAVDTLGNQTKDVRTITLDQAAPVLTVTTPYDNSITANPVITISGTIGKTSTVSVTVNSSTPQQAAMTGTSFAQDVTLAAGLNTITIVATDLATNTTTVKRTVTYDNIMPSLAVTNPSQDITTSQSTLTLTGTVADALSSVTITISVDGTTFTPEVTQGAFSQQLTFTTEGTHAVTVTATDQVNNSVSIVRNIIYTIPKPHVTINATTSPTTSTSQTIGGTMDADTVVTVTCSTATVGPVTYPTSTTWQVTLTGMATDTNLITVIATSTAGKASDPATASITVSSTPTGDLNGSGQVELADVMKVYQSVLGLVQLTDAEKKNADVAPLGSDGKPKGDGVVDIADVVLLLRHLIGLANW